MVRWASKLEETNEADTSNLRAAMQKAASLAKDTILDFCTFLQTSLQEAGQSRHTIQWWFLFPVSLSHVPAAPLVWLRGGGGVVQSPLQVDPKDCVCLTCSRRPGAVSQHRFWRQCSALFSRCSCRGLQLAVASWGVLSP